MLRTQLFFVCFLLSLVWVSGDEKNHKFADNEVIPLYANNVGPHWNPSETYSYYKLPFCPPAPDAKEKSPKLGQKLEGDRYMTSAYQLRFKDDMTDQSLCTKELSAEDVNKFIKAVKQKYYFEMRFDTLPIFGLVGSIEPHDETNVAPENIHYFLNTNLHFHAEYNGDRVIQINVTSDKFIELRENEPASVSFTYSVSWNPTDYPFKKRMDKYKNPFLPQELEIHWLSIMNSFVLVILLTGFLAIIIMRVLKSDYARYARTEDEEEDQEDYGWKLVHGDVFRFPPHKNLFTALLGIGSQFLSMMVCILLLAVGGLFYPHNPGNLYTAAIVLYAFCAGIGGFVSGRMYKQMNGDRWAWNIVLTATLFVVPFVLAVTYVNSVARHYKVSAALPFLAILEVLSIWLFVGFPLTVFGGIGGRRMAGQFEAPCRTKNFPREIPPIPWYRQLPFQMMMAGFLPFSAIYIELFYIYSSVWGHSSYTLYGILMLVFIILNVVTACITVALTYFQLSMEDHRWWWTSFINGGSTGIFIYAYSIFYYIYRSEMTGLIQGSFYFTYMLVVCFFFFLLLGSVGFFSSLIFVRRIYKNVKSD